VQKNIEKVRGRHAEKAILLETVYRVIALAQVICELAVESETLTRHEIQRPKNFHASSARQSLKEANK